MALTKISGGVLQQPIDVGIITATSIDVGIITVTSTATFNGNIGIGTTNPEAKLEVKDTGAQGIIVSAASTQQTNTNKALRVRNNNDTNTFFVSHRGQGYFEESVGIGSTQPRAKLDVLHSSNSESTAFFKNGGGSAPATVHIWEDNSSSLHYGLFVGEEDCTNPVLVTKQNNIGIGTTNPSALLQIKDGTDSGFSGAQLKIGDNTDTGIQINQASDNTGGPRLVFGKSRGTLDTPTTILTDDQLVTTRGYGYVGSTGGWVHGGYYGLHADGTVSDTPSGLDARFSVHTRYNGSSILERLRVYPSGTVGINTTTSPTIGGFQRPELYIKSTGNAWTGGFHIEESENDGVGCINHSVDGLEFSQSYRSNGAYRPIIFRTSGQRRVIISTDGAVGIGTTVPASLLTLNADSGNTDLELRRNNAAANGNRYGRIKFSSEVSTEVASISAKRWDNSDHTSYLTFATARGEGELTEKFQINSFGVLSGNHQYPDEGGTYRNTTFYGVTNHYHAYSAPGGTSGNNWMRFAYLTARGRYRFCFNWTGGYYGPGSVLFDVQLYWTSPYIYVGNINKLGSTYAPYVRSTSNVNGNHMYLELYVNVNSNQTNDHVHGTGQVLGPGERQLNMFNYGYNLSNLTYTSSSIAL